LVCVVYVGFDNGDNLDMQGAESALPIWADFMKEALARNPQWNGDWNMPADIHKAEIDTRDGTVIRELEGNETVTKDTDKNKPNAGKKNAGTAPDAADPNALPTDQADDPLVREKSVPPEFRRVELFVAGTIPMKIVPDEDTELPPDEPLPGESPEQAPTPQPKPSEPPVNGTWQDPSGAPTNKQSQQRRAPEDSKMVMVSICPITGLRATSKCPNPESKSFKAGTEPKDFCTFHR